MNLVIRLDANDVVIVTPVGDLDRLWTYAELLYIFLVETSRGGKVYESVLLIEVKGDTHGEKTLSVATCWNLDARSFTSKAGWIKFYILL